MKYKTCLLVVVFPYLTWFTGGWTYQIYLPVVDKGCSLCTSAPCPQKIPPRIFLGQGADVQRQPGLVKYESSLPVLLFINLTSIRDMRDLLLLIAFELKRAELSNRIYFCALHSDKFTHTKTSRRENGK